MNLSNNTIHLILADLLRSSKLTLFSAKELFKRSDIRKKSLFDLYSEMHQVELLYDIQEIKDSLDSLIALLDFEEGEEGELIDNSGYDYSRGD